MSEGFLGRWSRRKAEVREGRLPSDPPSSEPSASPSLAERAPTERSGPSAPGDPLPTSAAPPAVGGGGPPDAPAAPPAPTLADAQALTPESDFRRFVAPDVAPEVRNTAMKKLFADPHFNVMDGLDVYIDDYNRPDPLPAAMLREMSSARFLGLVQDEPAAAAGKAAPDPMPAAQAPAPAVARDDADGPGVSDVAQSGASETPTDHVRPNPDLQLQPDDAARREGVGPGPG